VREFSRLEDTITFNLIERAQFPLIRTIYVPGALQLPEVNLSFLDWLLREQERLHSRTSAAISRRTSIPSSPMRSRSLS
jgi:hypothetical protein